MIRPGTLEDLPQLIELGEKMRCESLVWYPPIEGDYLLENAKIVFSHPDKFCCFVVQNGSNIVGWLNGCVSGYLFSRMRIAIHDVFYVHPDHRRYANAVGLVRAFVGWAESLGIKRQVIRLDTALRPEKVDRFYRRLGFEPIGGQYVRDGGTQLHHRGSSGNR